MITHKAIFALIQSKSLHLGTHSPKHFWTENGDRTFGNIEWFANCKNSFVKKLTLNAKYTPEEYPKYDNFNIINVDKVENIPCDYNGIMGAPLTFLKYQNIEQYHILGVANDCCWLGSVECATIIHGKAKFRRLLIQKKQ